jgi:hypothetical protein
VMESFKEQQKLGHVPTANRIDFVTVIICLMIVVGYRVAYFEYSVYSRAFLSNLLQDCFVLSFCLIVYNGYPGYFSFIAGYQLFLICCEFYMYRSFPAFFAKLLCLPLYVPLTFFEHLGQVMIFHHWVIAVYDDLQVREVLPYLLYVLRQYVCEFIGVLFYSRRNFFFLVCVPLCGIYCLMALVKSQNGVI